jgi:hypothetical protein
MKELFLYVICALPLNKKQEAKNMPRMRNFIIRDNVRGETVGDTVPAANTKSALKKFRKDRMSTGFYELTHENGTYHLRSSFGGDWTAELAE